MDDGVMSGRDCNGYVSLFLILSLGFDLPVRVVGEFIYNAI